MPRLDRPTSSSQQVSSERSGSEPIHVWVTAMDLSLEPVAALTCAGYIAENITYIEYFDFMHLVEPWQIVASKCFGDVWSDFEIGMWVMTSYR